jgi:hypothetical protein
VCPAEEKMHTRSSPNWLVKKEKRRAGGEGKEITLFASWHKSSIAL